MSKSVASIISIYPLALNESKPGLNPGTFVIPACEDMSNPVIVHLGPSTHYLYMGEHRTYPIENNAIDVAAAVVQDILSAMIEYKEDAHAGLVAVNGIVNQLQLKTEHKMLMIRLKEKQERWLKKLVELADNDWAKTHSHVAISDIQRKAAELLNLTDREWLSVTRSYIPMRCPACQSLIPPESIICSNCKVVIDKEKAKNFDFARSA